jgi:hypothetical protein
VDDNGITIKVEKAALVNRLLLVKESIPTVLMAMGISAKAILSPYPPSRYVSRKSVYGSSFKSAKQRGWFFAQVAEGKMQTYRRGQSSGSQTFGLRWFVQMEGDKRVVVGNNTTYGPLLMDDEKQSIYMRARGWQKVRERLDEKKIAALVDEGSQILSRIGE